MANAAGFIQESIWRDEHWRRLSRSSQALYMQLLCQKELDCAGILPLQPNKWAKGCADLTIEQVWSDLNELQREQFVFYDIETDEVFVRTYIRNSNVIKVPNMMKSALRAAVLVGSEFIKPLLATELRATGRDDAIKIAHQINPSETLPEPFPNGSGGTLSEPLPEPFAKPTGVGVGMGVGVTPRSTQVGERRPQCSKHEENTDTGCRACMRRREWDEQHAERTAADDLNRKRLERAAATKARDDCTMCDGDGWLLGSDGTPVEPAVKCVIHEAQRRDA